MRVLVTWGSERGGTEGIARIIAKQLRSDGHEVHARPAREATAFGAYDAVIVGGALYANRWHRDAVQFVLRNTLGLRRLPVWFFSSGPLDDSARWSDIPPTRKVQTLMERVGALGHQTFGGRLTPDAKGLLAAAMAKEHAGDWRDTQQIQQWADRIAGELRSAHPGKFIDHPAASTRCVIMHGVLGWAACAALMGALLALVNATLALTVHAVAVPLVFAAISTRYFSLPGSREPLPTALGFTSIVFVLDFIVVAWVLMGSFGMFASIVGTWLPLALIFLSTWLTGFIVSTLPWPKADKSSHTPKRAHG